MKGKRRSKGQKVEKVEEEHKVLGSMNGLNLQSDYAKASSDKACNVQRNLRNTYLNRYFNRFLNRYFQRAA